jgi:hypothetical protein
MSDNNKTNVNDFTTSKWENIVPSAMVSILVGAAGLTALIHGTKRARKSHFMNVFNILFFALFSSAMLVRCFYWTTWLNRGTPGNKDD